MEDILQKKSEEERVKNKYSAECSEVDFCVDGNETLVSIKRGILHLAQRVLTFHKRFCL